MTPVLVLFLCMFAGSTVQSSDPEVADIVQKLGAYVAGYGAKTYAIVGVEKYSQLVLLEGVESPPPRRLVAEFAVVRSDAGWIGVRDIVEINSKPVEDRKKRLERMLLEMKATEADFRRIASESARFSIGAMHTSLNIPTTALFFFTPENLSRFAFTRKGSKKIDGVETVELEFKETHRPTLIMKRAGTAVPIEGSLWVVAADGTVVRTRMRVKNFADALAMPSEAAGPLTGTRTPSVGGGSYAQELDTYADIQVTYKRIADMGLWLPSEMTEQYQGPILGLKTNSAGRTNTDARYSEFKTFAAGPAVRK